MDENESAVLIDANCIFIDGQLQESLLTESEYCIPRNYVDTFTCYLTSPISEVQFWLRGNCRISMVPTTRPFLPLRAAQTVVMLTVLHTQPRHCAG